jgi:hypothetical protein
MSTKVSPLLEEAVVDAMQTPAQPQDRQATEAATTTAVIDNDQDHEHLDHDAEATTAEEIHQTIIHPGSVRINVEGAFIVESPPGSPTEQPVKSGRISPTQETSDIRLPNHTAVVSHIAVDVSGALFILFPLLHGSFSSFRDRISNIFFSLSY